MEKDTATMERITLPLSEAGRHNLEAIYQELDRCSRQYGGLYHQRMFPMSEYRCCTITSQQWAAFKQAAGELEGEEWWQWDGASSDEDYLCLWFGDPSGLEEFATLSESIEMVLSRESINLEELNLGGGPIAVPGWVHYLHNWAFKYQMPLLRHDMYLWEAEDAELEEWCELLEHWDTLDDGTTFPRHPVVRRLVDNVFTSSMTAIRALLWPDLVIATNEPWPVVGGIVQAASKVECATETVDNAERKLDPNCHQLIFEDVLCSIVRSGTGQRLCFQKKVGFQYIAMLLKSPDKKFTPMEVYSILGQKPTNYGHAATRHDKEGQSEAALQMTVRDSLDTEQELVDLLADQEARAEYERLLERYEQAHLPSGDDAEESLRLEEKIAAFRRGFVHDRDEKGKVRHFPKPEWEKSRKAVSAGISRAIKEIKAKSEDLAKQLEVQIDRSSGFTYRPKPDLPRWEVVTRIPTRN